MTATPRTLILGWGNPARGDDGLGPALIGMVRGRAGKSLTIDSDYQLHIEDAAELAGHDRVVFVDADRTGPAPFSCQRLTRAQTGLSFTTHSVSPAALLTLSGRLFGQEPEAWMVGIRGYRFDAFDESLSSRARANLAATVAFFEDALRAGRFEEVPASGGTPSKQAGPGAGAEDTP